MRIVYVLLFCIIFGFSDIVLFLVALLQSIVFVFKGEPNTDLQSFGSSLAEYLKQIVRFVTFKSDEKPFPFADWPSAAEPESDVGSN